MDWTYEIMHLDVVAARISSDGSCRISAVSFLPWNLYLEEDPGQDLSIQYYMSSVNRGSFSRLMPERVFI